MTYTETHPPSYVEVKQWSGPGGTWRAVAVWPERLVRGWNRPLTQECAHAHRTAHAARLCARSWNVEIRESA
jgi:hypothetical protein